MKTLLACGLTLVPTSYRWAVLCEIVRWQKISPEARSSYETPPKFRHAWLTRWILAVLMIVMDRPKLFVAWVVCTTLFCGTQLTIYFGV